MVDCVMHVDVIFMQAESVAYYVESLLCNPQNWVPCKQQSSTPSINLTALMLLVVPVSPFLQLILLLHG